MLKHTLKLFCSVVDKIVMWAGKGASYLMPILAFIVVYEVTARYVFDAPTIWAYDLSLFLFGYVAALGGAYAQQKRTHINVDILYAKVPVKVRDIFNLISYSLGIFFLIIVFWMCMGKLIEAWTLNYTRQSEWAPPMWHFWAMLCIASSLFTLQLVRDIVLSLYHLFTEDNLLEEEK
ncbi:MAG: TRAP transporter small permease subunit [Ostreibacterium sp.]